MKVIIGTIISCSLMLSGLEASAYRAAIDQLDHHSNENCHSLSSCMQNYDQFDLYGDAQDYPMYVYAEGSARKFPDTIPLRGKRTFFFSPRYKRWAAYDESGQRVGHGIANGGKHFCPDLGRPCRTPRGTFSVHSKGSPGCKSNKFPLGRGGAPMPYCMFFHKGYAIHGSPYISNRNGSHGCIRVTNTAAAWLSNNFMRHGTRVVVLPY